MTVSPPDCILIQFNLVKETVMALENSDLFTYIWTIENFQMSKTEKGNYFLSSYFHVKKFMNTKWILALYPRGSSDSGENIISCSMFYSRRWNSIEEVKVTYELYFSENPFVEEKEKIKEISRETKLFKKGNETKHVSVKRDSVYSRESPFPRTIFIVCKLWMNEADIQSYTLEHCNILLALIPNHFKQSDTKLPSSFIEKPAHVGEDIRNLQKKICYFPNSSTSRTVLPVERITFSLLLNEITAENVWSRFFMSNSDIPDLFIAVVLNYNKSIKVNIQAIGMNSNSFTLVCNVSVLDSAQKIQDFIEKEHYFKDCNSDKCEIELKIKNLREKQQSLKTGILMLNCEIIISTGSSFSFIEETLNIDAICHQYSAANFDLANVSPTLTRIYASKKFSDVTLHVGSKSLQAHKAILCCSSPVFDAMFSSDMKENKSNDIPIEDVEVCTMNQLLMFMYLGTLKCVSLDEASKLYRAADKYQMLSLKHKCALYIISNMKPEKACSALQIADAFGDKELKNAISQFIFHHKNSILPTEEWRMFREKNVQLASDVLQEICMKL